MATCLRSPDLPRLVLFVDFQPFDHVCYPSLPPEIYIKAIAAPTAQSPPAPSYKML